MEKEFVPYELALRMKQLGFDEPCLKAYDKNSMLYHSHKTDKLFTVLNSNLSTQCSAPLYQQAFRWFREKYDFSHSINKTYRGQYMPYVNGEELLDINSEKKVDDNVIDDFGYKWLYDSYEEAELACLEKLIEIVEQ